MKGRRSNCCEIQDSDIRQTVAAQGLVPYRPETFTPVAWCSYQRAAN